MRSSPWVVVVGVLLTSCSSGLLEPVTPAQVDVARDAARFCVTVTRPDGGRGTSCTRRDQREPFYSVSGGVAVVADPTGRAAVAELEFDKGILRLELVNGVFAWTDPSAPPNRIRLLDKDGDVLSETDGDGSSE